MKFALLPISQPFPRRKRPCRNKVEQDIITRELLDQVTSFPHLRPSVFQTLQCIRELGPDRALKEHAYTASGDPDKWKRDRGRRPILDPDAIAELWEPTGARSIEISARQGSSCAMSSTRTADCF